MRKLWRWKWERFKFFCIQQLTPLSRWWAVKDASQPQNQSMTMVLLIAINSHRKRLWKSSANNDNEALNETKVPSQVLIDPSRWEIMMMSRRCSCSGRDRVIKIWVGKKEFLMFSHRQWFCNKFVRDSDDMQINQLADSRHVQAWKTKARRWIFDWFVDFTIVLAVAE